MWKQPIPTYIPELENNQFILLLFQSILLECSNTDKEVLLKDGTNVSIKRGQCIFGRFKWNKKFYFTKNSQIVERMLRKAQFLNNNLNIKPTNKYTIITVINYDKWVSLEQQDEQQLNNSRTTAEQQLNTSKSIKSVKSEESDIETYIKEFNKLFGREYRITKSREIKLNQRLKSYTQKDLLKALKNMAGNKFYLGGNASNWEADPDYLLRNDDIVDRLLNKVDKSNNSINPF